MPPRIASCACTSLFVALYAGLASAGPTDSKLLSLVPPGAQVLSGFENKHNNAGGPLVMTTVNNVRDLEDWCALAGVDPGRQFTDVIEVTLAPSGKELNEHVVLASGTFHRDLIFHSAEVNGARRSSYVGVPVLVIEPFSREKDVMKDTRWLVILDDRLVAFGTPAMVQQVLMRFENRVAPDPVLMQRLALLRRDVNSWSMFTSAPGLEQSLFVRSRSPLSTLADNTDLLMMGVRFDKAVRVDILVDANQEDKSVDVKEKADQISRVFTLETAEGDNHKPLVKNVQLGKSRVQASVVLSNEQFVLWKMGQSHQDQATINSTVARTRNETARAASLGKQ